MKRLIQFVTIVGSLGALIAFMTHQNRALKALSEQQRTLSASVDRAERTAQAERVEHALLATLSPRPPVAGADAPAAESQPSAPSRPGQEPPAPLPEPAAYVAKIESSFAAEGPDGAWDRVAGAALKSQFATPDLHSLRSIDCRASMCRVVTDDDGAEATTERIRRIVDNPLDEVWSGAYVSRVEGADTSHPQRVMYFFRKGVSLPML
jgi:hypothetical protein